MTRGQQYAPPNPLAQYEDLLGENDEDLSPSDGYFRGNNSIPNTLLIPDPSYPPADPSSNNSKAKEAAREANSSETNSPSTVRYTSYTPATTHTPATSSGDSESAYNGSTSRYRDAEDELSQRSPLLDEAPPLYDEAMAEGASGSNMNGSNNAMPPPQTGYQSMQVRDPVSSFRTSGFGSRSTPQRTVVGVVDSSGKIYDEESDPALPPRSRRRRCCGKRSGPKEGRNKCKRLVLLLLGSFLAIWLIGHLVWIRRLAHGRSHAPNLPINGTFPPGQGSVSGRQYRQHETSQSISGYYPLYDLLDLKTTSGSISITVVPHPGDMPAVLRIASTSGSINIKIDNKYLDAAQTGQHHDILNRTFETRISTTSGSIRGSILIGGGGTTSISSTSGSQNLAFYPVNVGHGSPESMVSTSSSSGTSNIKVHSSIFGGTTTQLVALHKSIGSGSMNIMYPSTWEGGIHVKSLGSGSVNVRGPGLQFDQYGNREVVGWRGGEKNRKMIDIEAVGSGSVNFRC